MEPAATDRIQAVLRNAVAALRRLQRPDGSWCGTVHGDSTLESDYLLMKFVLREERHPMSDGSGPEVLDRLAAGLRAQQRADGSWGAYPGSGPDLDATVKAYFALKLMGDDPDTDPMRAARERVLAGGGAACSTGVTRMLLACLGQLSWRAVESVPPELVLLPQWCIARVGTLWGPDAASLLPRSIVTTRRPIRIPPPGCGIDELFVDPSGRDHLPEGRLPILCGLDRVLKFLHPLGGTPLRGVALRRLVERMRRPADPDDSTVHPPVGVDSGSMVVWRIALGAMGLQGGDPDVRRLDCDLEADFVEMPDRHGSDVLRIQPCRPAVRDTGHALDALRECGLDEHDPSVRGAVERLRSMGGACGVPRDDAGRVLEHHARRGATVDHPDVRWAVIQLRREQTRDGAWIGRQGVNYIHGTWRVLEDSIRCGVDPSEEWVQRAGRWLQSVQQADGSFGESPDSDLDPSKKGQGPSAASQTAWAAMAMQAVFGHEHAGVRHAVQWLAATQLSESEASDPTINPDGDLPGSWVEPWSTGRSGASYTRDQLYRLSFPIMAIARWLEAEQGFPPIEPIVRIEPKLIAS